MSLKKKLIYSLIILFLLITPAYLYAKSDDEQEIEDIDVTKVEKQDKDEELKQKREEEKQKLKEKKEELKAKREEIKEELKTKKEELKQAFEERKEELKKIREEAREKFSEEREDFEDRLTEIKDKKKQAIVERVDSKITTLNNKHTDRFNALLEKLSSILDRIESKADELEGEGANISSVDVAVQIARDAIAAAQREITEQAGKDYIIVIDSESNLGNVVSSAFKEFREDMEALKDSIKVARDAVHEAAKTLKDLIKSSNTTDESAE